MARIKVLIAKLLCRIADSLPTKILGLAASIFTILPFIMPVTSEPTPLSQLHATSNQFVVVDRKPPAPVTHFRVASIPFAHTEATTQTTYSIQSPNVHDVPRDVRIKYGSLPEIPKGLSENTSASYRIQSPDVSHVGGSVDIEYGTESKGAKAALSETPWTLSAASVHSFCTDPANYTLRVLQPVVHTFYTSPANVADWQRRLPDDGQ